MEGTDPARTSCQPAAYVNAAPHGWVSARQPGYDAAPTETEAPLADDPYTLLGIPKTATEKQIRAAFLGLAKTSHPDLNPGDRKAEERFKAISGAHDLLSDPVKRARFDRGELDAAGQEAPPRGYERSSGQRPGGRAGAGFATEGMDDILASMFGQRGGPPRTSRGADQRYTLTVSFLDAARGATQRLALPGGGELDVQIPPGTESGHILRLRGKGGAGTAGGPAGDAMIEITVTPHPLFRREERDIHLDLPVTLAEAVLGGRVTVPTVAGAVTMGVPAGSDSGTRLRLRGKGIPAHGALPAGDAYATLRVRVGPADDALRDFLTTWSKDRDFDPRADLDDD